MLHTLVQRHVVNVEFIFQIMASNVGTRHDLRCVRAHVWWARSCSVFAWYTAKTLRGGFSIRVSGLNDWLSNCEPKLHVTQRKPLLYVHDLIKAMGRK
jgi:hypothetical protein